MKLFGSVGKDQPRAMEVTARCLNCDRCGQKECVAFSWEHRLTHCFACGDVTSITRAA